MLLITLLIAVATFGISSDALFGYGSSSLGTVLFGSGSGVEGGSGDGGILGGWGVFNKNVKVNDVIFTLMNYKNNYVEQIISPSIPSTFEKSSWDPNQKTVIVIHGYTESGTIVNLFSASKGIIKAYAQVQRPENFVFVDWHSLGRQLNYFRSAKNTESVGFYVAGLLVFLRQSKYVRSLQDVHIIGFSLGAHVAGMAGSSASSFLRENVGRITGLDPAGPAFRNAAIESRLDPGDADFVDVIHTNMGPLLTNFGTTTQSGHVDFYPNGGEHQPGCGLALLGEVVGLCSHLKAVEYFSKTILGKVYAACPCSDYPNYVAGACNCDNPTLMGEYADKMFRGKFYLTIPEGE